MTGFRKRFFVLGLTLCAGLLRADADKDTWKKYNNLIDDSDLYTGEGVVQVSEYGGDPAKAGEAAVQRARAALAASIRVHVSSETKETIKGNAQSVTETIETKSSEATDLAIDNVHTREFKDFPDPGKTTVIAYVSKEDYRRQLAGVAVPVYRPQFGVAVGVDLLDLQSFKALVSRSAVFNQNRPAPVTSGAAVNIIMPSVPGSMFGYNLAVTWPFLVLEAGYYQQNILLWSLHRNSATTSSDSYRTDAYSVSVLMLEAGYDWTPRLWRLQPYVPLRVKAALLNMNDTDFAGQDDYHVDLYGASAGLGVRYWLNGEFSFEASGTYNLALNSGILQGKSSDFSDRTLHFTPTDAAPALDLSGLQLHAGIKWSGF
jgi:hypothetical protein